MAIQVPPFLYMITLSPCCRDRRERNQAGEDDSPLQLKQSISARYKGKLKQRELKNCFHDMQTVLINVLWESDCRRLPVEDGSSLWAPCQPEVTWLWQVLGWSWTEMLLRGWKMLLFWQESRALGFSSAWGWFTVFVLAILDLFSVKWISPGYIPNQYIGYVLVDTGLGWDLPWNRFPSIVQASTRWLWHLTGGTAVQHKVFPTGISLNWCSRSSKNRHFISS